jgi:two-component system chemotaxis sensor kinase CheA
MIDKFRAKFVEESKDNVQDLEEALFLLEKDMENRELIERIFRAMHSLKGGGAMFGFNDLSEFTHDLETIFDSVRNQKILVTTDLISLTFLAIDEINILLNTGDLTEVNDKEELARMTNRIRNFMGIGSGKVPDASVKAAVSPTVKITQRTAEKGELTYLITFIPELDLLQNGTNPFFLMDDLYALGTAKCIAYIHKIPSLDLFCPTSNYCVWQILLSTTESVNEIKDVFIFVEDECQLIVDLVANKPVVDLPAIKAIIQKAKDGNVLLKKEDFDGGEWQKEEVSKSIATPKKATVQENKISSIRVSSYKIDELVTLVSELVTIQAQLSLYAENSGEPSIMALTESVQKLSRQLRENAFEISLIPLQSELMRFQRLVRDLSKEQNKDIDFVIEGGDIELDKNIIENLTDPLLHILRNSIDHGIELPNDRISAGKSPKGTILFKAYYSGANVIIEVSDDGKGLDPDFILQKAIDKGIVEEGAELDKKEILNLIFLSGFSTRDAVTEVSGRGVGMDVVRRKIAEIRGEASVESEKGKGTIITIRLPMTLSIIDGLLVNVSDNKYVIPLSSIEKIYALESTKFRNTFNRVVELDGEQVPYINLRDAFNIEPLNEKNQAVQMVVVKSDDQLSGIVVDSVVGEYQTVVKPLGKYLRHQEILSGASIMGDGSISMVIDTSRLLQTRKVKK